MGAELARARDWASIRWGFFWPLNGAPHNWRNLPDVWARSDINSFLEQEMAARRVFFRDKPDLANQLKRWRKRLERLLERLISLHRSLLADSRNADLQLWHALSEITRRVALGLFQSTHLS
jgi:DNA polymerase-3 subunit delta